MALYTDLRDTSRQTMLWLFSVLVLLLWWTCLRVESTFCRFETFEKKFTPLCLWLFEETLKAVDSFYLVSVSGKVKYPTYGNWKTWRRITERMVSIYKNSWGAALAAVKSVALIINVLLSAVFSIFLRIYNSPFSRFFRVSTNSPLSRFFSVSINTPFLEPVLRHR